MSDPISSPATAQLQDSPEANPPIGIPQLSALAQQADGAEGKELVLSFIESTNKLVVETTEEAAQPGHTVILRGIKVPAAPAKLNPVTEILVRREKTSGTTSAKVGNVLCDSVFTTSSSMRKFVLLYYESHRLLDDTDMKKLKQLINDPEVSAVGHIHPSSYAAIGEGPGLMYLPHDSSGEKALAAGWRSLEEYELKEKR